MFLVCIEIFQTFIKQNDTELTRVREKSKKVPIVTYLKVFTALCKIIPQNRSFNTNFHKSESFHKSTRSLNVIFAFSCIFNRNTTHLGHDTEWDIMSAPVWHETAGNGLFPRYWIINVLFMSYWGHSRVMSAIVVGGNRPDCARKWWLNLIICLSMK